MLIGRLALSMLLLFGLTAFAPANAITIVGKWDPSFGAAFPDLGWRGQATFFVPDACLAQNGWVLNSDSCSAFGMKIVKAEVEFYKLSDPTNAAFQETLLFSTPSPVVLSMDINAGLLEGVYGAFLYSVPSTIPLAGGGYTDFALLFEGDLARMFYVSSPPGGPKSAGFSDRSPADGRPFMTFSVVPEPTSLSLVGLGLLLTAWVARRPRVTQEPSKASRA